MSFDGLLVTEIFHSLQGETSLSGERFSFIRLTGCNLRCAYCDTPYAFHGKNKMSISEVLSTIKSHKTRHVLVTGGEPLLQKNTNELFNQLHQNGYQVSLETHGEVSIESVPSFVRIIMDIKTPGSQMNRGHFKKNLPFLKNTDEIKFVITSEEDYLWAKNWITNNPVSQTCLFSPVVQSKNNWGTVQGVSENWLAEQILKDHLNVRFQVQLHKIIWGAETQGV